MESSAGLSWGALFPDPTSTLLGARLGTDNQASWLDVHSGTRLERGRLGTLGSRGDLVVVGRSDRRGFTLFDQRGTRELLALAPDFEATLTAIFSPDGQRVAWGTRSGAVLALDLAEMNRRLSEIGLGW
jgi:hypothetical protein